ncbi:MAG: hypothetical protein CVU38_19390 [Chloroflexi bacterium HGW-Chloroflexi-1]|nr:MAG: hypothetical protein CVU38_19390 [Chloroflexi bacterium HGW-Chloroflexi-1]
MPDTFWTKISYCRRLPDCLFWLSVAFRRGVAGVGVGVCVGLGVEVAVAVGVGVGKAYTISRYGRLPGGSPQSPVLQSFDQKPRSC